MTTIKICEFCHKRYYDRQENQRWCSKKCRDNDYKKMRDLETEMALVNQEEKKKPQYHPRKRTTIEQINRAAARENLSYGQYVAKYHL